MVSIASTKKNILVSRRKDNKRNRWIMSKDVNKMQKKTKRKSNREICNQIKNKIWQLKNL